MDPGVTAQFERLLDGVLIGSQEMAGAVDAVRAQALRVIERLTDGMGAQPLRPVGEEPVSGKAVRGKKAGGGRLPPTQAMKRYVASLSRQKGVVPPAGWAKSGAVCCAFLDQHAPREGRAGEGAPPVAVWPAVDELFPQQPDAPASGAAVAGGQAPSPPWNRKGRALAASTRRTSPAGRKTTPSPAVQDRPRAGSRTGVHPEAGGTPPRIPFGNKEAAQKLGVCYGAGGWYAPPGVALDPFRKRGWV